MLKKPALFLLLFLFSCSTSSSFNKLNSCNITSVNPSWLRAMKKTENKYGTPVPLQLAFIYQESSFNAHARPPRKKFLGFIPSWQRISSAKGYTQALDGTWNEYKKTKFLGLASRSSFKNSSDFIGWYTSKTRTSLNVPFSQVANHYLAYHEGRGGFKRRSYLKKPSLLKIAKKVQFNAKKYQRQLNSC